MRFSTTAAALSFALLAAAQQNHSVDVGLNGLTYTPNTVIANVGDIITFTFHPKNHTLTQSTFGTPCSPAFDSTTGQEGFDTGFIPVAAGQVSAPMSIRVTTTTPLWFFCRQTGHCLQGMVFAINPTANKTFAQFQANAMNPATASSASLPGASATEPGAAAPTDPAASDPAASDPASEPPAASDPAAADPTDSTDDGYGYGSPTDSGSPTDGTDGSFGNLTGTGAPSSSTGKPNGASVISPRGVLFTAAALLGAVLLL